MPLLVVVVLSSNVLLSSSVRSRLGSVRLRLTVAVVSVMVLDFWQLVCALHWMNVVELVELYKFIVWSVWFCELGDGSVPLMESFSFAMVVVVIAVVVTHCLTLCLPCNIWTKCISV